MTKFEYDHFIIDTQEKLKGLDDSLDFGPLEVLFKPILCNGLILPSTVAPEELCNHLFLLQRDLERIKVDSPRIFRRIGANRCLQSLEKNFARRLRSKLVRY